MTEEKKPDEEKINNLTLVLESVKLYLERTLQLGSYIMQQSEMTDIEIEFAQKEATDIISSLGPKIENLGVLFTTMSFAYVGVLKSIVRIIEDQIGDLNGELATLNSEARKTFDEIEKSPERVN